MGRGGGTQEAAHSTGPVGVSGSWLSPGEMGTSLGQEVGDRACGERASWGAEPGANPCHPGSWSCKGLARTLSCQDLGPDESGGRTVISAVGSTMVPSGNVLSRTILHLQDQI